MNYLLIYRWNHAHIVKDLETHASLMMEDKMIETDYKELEQLRDHLTNANEIMSHIKCDLITCNSCMFKAELKLCIFARLILYIETALPLMNQYFLEQNHETN